ncbi:MAG: cation:proton antiporter [Acidobacteria bacterium]|nr:cation:proton antiporter [Acidobacteriota bacterium]
MEYLKDLIVIFGLAVGVVVVFSRLRLPAVIGYLATGTLVGPHGLGWIEGAEQVQVLAELGVALLLFTIGIELSLAQLFRMRTTLWLGGGLQVACTVVLVALVALPVLPSWKQSVFLGMLVALSSTAIVLKLLSERGELDSPHGQMALGILIFQDLCIVPMTLLTPFLSGETAGVEEVALVAGKAVLVVGASLLGARFVVPWFLHQVVATRNREVFLLSLVLLCMGTAWLTAQAGLSLALGAFLAGLVVSESEYSHQALGEILPLRHAFLGIFFVSVGMLFDGRTLLIAPWNIAVGVAALVAGKAAITAGVSVVLGHSRRVSLITGLGLAQVGEFSFVLATVGLSSGVITEPLYQLFIGAAIITMAATPFLWGLSARLSQWLTSWQPSWIGGSQEAPEGSAVSDELKDHVIIVGYGVNGKNLARVLRRVPISYIVVEMNPEIVRTESREGTHILYGDAANQQILERAGVRRARVLVLAISDPSVTRHATDTAHRLNPALHIIIRTRYVKEMEALFALGGNDVVPEEFETSIEIFSRVLRRYMVPRDIVERSVREIRQDGYEMFRGLQERHHPAEDIRRFVAGVEMEIYRVEPGSPLTGHSLAEANLRGKSGAMVLAIQANEQIQPNPDPGTVFSAGDVVMLLGTPEQLARAAALFGGVPASGSEEAIPEA